jgi:membrane-associated protease RseP (regulator of RpoE activity)
MMSQTRAREFLDAIAEFARTLPWTTVLGFMAAKMAALNALPIPVLNGGEALLTILQWRRPPQPWRYKIQYAGLLFMLWFAIAYLIAFVSFLFRGV